MSTTPRFEGQVALITGAARGQGRSHAVALAREGANIVIQDLCEDIATVPYKLSTEEDLAETARLVEAEGREVIAEKGDVRDLAGLRALVAKTKEKFGRLDIAIANAGIMAALAEGDEDQGFYDSIDIMLVGVWNTIRATMPLVIEGGRGGSLIMTSSAAGLRSMATANEAGSIGYGAAKHGLVGLMRTYANRLGPHSIRVNTIHPTGVNTDMIVNEAFGKFVEDYPEIAGAMQNLLPVPMIEVQDVTNAILFLASDEGRYVHGTTFQVDAGYIARA